MPEPKTVYLLNARGAEDAIIFTAAYTDARFVGYICEVARKMVPQFHWEVAQARCDEPVLTLQMIHALSKEYEND
jgi:hypothetical protein